MKKSVSIRIVLGLILCQTTSLFPQQQVSNYHSGNKLRLTFKNDGAVEGGDDLTAEWPIGTGHEYLSLGLPLVAVESGGNKAVAAFAFNNSYASSTDGLVAMSHKEETWPASWPDRPASWDGKWNGYFGSGQFNADQESYFVLEDDALGLRLSVRGWQWSHYLAQDMVIWNYELTNTGSSTYDNVALGYFADPDAGGDGTDDRLTFQEDRAQVRTQDSDATGVGKGVAKHIGEWGGVGLLSTALLETPGNAGDGIDNDGDGLIDESRSDGIDNDGDWNSETDDVGADGVPESGDAGEGDGVPSPGEPNFDATDVDESDQIGLTSFAAFPDGGLNLQSASDVWSALAAGRVDDTGGAGEYLLGTGGFALAPGETQRFSVVLFVSTNNLDQDENEKIVDQIYQDNYRFPIAPPRPGVTAVAEDRSVTLYWDRKAESVPDFEGYKIYRSTDPGFNDVFSVTNDRAVVIYSKVAVTFDLDNNVSDLFGLDAGGFRYFLGNDTGLKHWWTDTNVDNGKTYYYAVVAYDRGDEALGIFPTESPKSIVADLAGNIITDRNTAVVVPTAESAQFASEDLSLDHTAGVATGVVEIEVVDRTAVKDGARYMLTFDDTSFAETTYSLFDITQPADPIPIFEHSTNYSSDEFRNDSDPIFDGLHFFLFPDELAWDSLATEWKVGDSNWSIELTMNSNLGTPEPEPADYEVRFGEAGVDTAIFSTPIPIPFQVWNVTDNKKESVLVLDQNGDGSWNSGEGIFVVTGSTLQNFRPTKWTITLTQPADSSVVSRPPESGDIAFIPTFKPFASNDQYNLTTQGIAVRSNVSKSVLDEIAVVPNPYLVNSSLERLSLYTGGQQQRALQFINLPTRCTIRIFTIRGSLVDVIEHDSFVDNGSEFWDLQSTDNKTVAYGVYVYHVDAPDVGETVGRFAIIR